MPDTDAGEQDLLAATQGQTRRVRPEFVNYAKRAKRVDVRKLKDNIWRGLDIIVAQHKKEDEEDDSMVSTLVLMTPMTPLISCGRTWTKMCHRQRILKRHASLVK